ncbi:MAG TPA: hypothetical protein VLM79_12510 [Kofleriaceae bacterium]|nr:hypothetical protein [Kofleriaceae bacterium]
MTIAVLCAIAVGSLVGSLAAIRLHPTPADPPAATPPAATPTAVTPPAAPTAPATPPISQPHAPDPHAVLVIQMSALLGRVAEWSRSHIGKPCPDAVTLGIASLDPWGHPIELTCTDQPADQIMGAISTGPDGIAGNSDDVKSWNLGPSVTQLVQGARWPTRPVASKPTRRRPPTERGPTIPRTPAAKSDAPSPAPVDAGDDIPTRR